MTDENRTDRPMPASTEVSRADTAPAPVASHAERCIALGERLKAARVRQDLSVTALCQMTRISVAFLDALEAGQFERLPGAVFGRGFVRSIARTTGLSADETTELVQAFDGLWNREPPKSVLKVEIKNKPNLQRGEALSAWMGRAGGQLVRGPVLKIAVPAVAVVALIVVVVAVPGVRSLFKADLFKSSTASLSTPVKTLDLKPDAADQMLSPTPAAATADKDAGHTTEDAPKATALEPSAIPDISDATVAATESAQPVVAAATKPETTPEATAAGDQVLELTVVEPVRIRLEVDNGTSVTKELTPDTYRFTFAKQADMMVYDAAALKISFNGKPVGPLGAKGRVRRLSFEAAAAPAEKK